MRYQGILKWWNAERGFGFIVANDGGQDIFVHISAFPRDGTFPTEGEPLAFDIEPDRAGKKMAVRVSRAGGSHSTRTHAPAHPASRRMSRAPQATGFGGKLIAVLVVAALGWYGYSHYAKRTEQWATPQPVSAAVQPAVSLFEATPTSSTATAFTCDGRKYCSQMTSCKEAKKFLKNCPGMEMDGNHDGVPCEQQWCTSPFAD